MLVLFDNTVIGDTTSEGKSIYLRVEKATGLKFHSKFRYLEDNETPEQLDKLNKMGYELKYFDGCFYPYLCKIIRRQL